MSNLSKLGITIEEYSPLSIAIFGDTSSFLPYKERLESIGGTFNRNLKGPNDTKRPGWIFQKSKKEQILNLFQAGPQAITPSTSSSSFSSFSSSSSSSSSLSSSTTSTISTQPPQQSNLDMKKVESMFLQLTSRIEALENECSTLRKWVLDFKEICETKKIDITKDCSSLSLSSVNITSKSKTSDKKNSKKTIKQEESDDIEDDSYSNGEDSNVEESEEVEKTRSFNS